MKNFSSPLGLREKIQQPSRHLEWVPLVDGLLIALLIALLSSRFIFAPGLTLNLPESHREVMAGVATTEVVTVKQGNMIFFKGDIYTIETFEEALTQYFERKVKEKEVLLVKMDKQVAMGVCFDICDIAYNAGFSHVQLAGNVSDKAFSDTKSGFTSL